MMMLRKKNSKSGEESVNDSDFPDVPTFLPVVSGAPREQTTQSNHNPFSHQQATQNNNDPFSPQTNHQNVESTNYMNPFGGRLKPEHARLLHGEGNANARMENKAAPNLPSYPPMPQPRASSEGFIAPAKQGRSDEAFARSLQQEEEQAAMRQSPSSFAGSPAPVQSRRPGNSSLNDEQLARQLQSEEEARIHQAERQRLWAQQQQAQKDAFLARQMQSEEEKAQSHSGRTPPPAQASQQGAGMSSPTHSAHQANTPSPADASGRRRFRNPLGRKNTAQNMESPQKGILDHMRNFLVGDNEVQSTRPGRVIRPYQIEQQSETRDANGRPQRLWQAIVYTGQGKRMQLVGLYDTRQEAVVAAEAYSPPHWEPKRKGLPCACCGFKFGVLRPEKHCRNCGRVVCQKCCETEWSPRMLPSTYVEGEKKCRICDNCANAMERFRASLKSGSVADAQAAYRTGVVNLRSPYTIYGGEYPVHCAADGGSLPLLIWLVEERGCFVRDPQNRARPLCTGDGATSCMSLAAVQGNLDMMRWLMDHHSCKLQDITSMDDLYQVIEKLMGKVDTQAPALDIADGQAKYENNSGIFDLRPPPQAPVQLYTEEEAMVPSSLPEAYKNVALEAAAVDQENALQNECIVCFEKEINTVMVPCGHTACCEDCSAQFTECPVCRKPVTQVIKTFGV